MTTLADVVDELLHGTLNTLNKRVPRYTLSWRTLHGWRLQRTQRRKNMHFLAHTVSLWLSEETGSLVIDRVFGRTQGRVFRLASPEVSELLPLALVGFIMDQRRSVAVRREELEVGRSRETSR